MHWGFFLIICKVSKIWISIISIHLSEAQSPTKKTKKQCWKSHIPWNCTHFSIRISGHPRDTSGSKILNKWSFGPEELRCFWGVACFTASILSSRKQKGIHSIRDTGHEVATHGFVTAWVVVSENPRLIQKSGEVGSLSYDLQRVCDPSQVGLGPSDFSEASTVRDFQKPSPFLGEKNTMCEWNALIVIKKMVQLNRKSGVEENRIQSTYLPHVTSVHSSQ